MAPLTTANAPQSASESSSAFLDLSFMLASRPVGSVLRPRATARVHSSALTSDAVFPIRVDRSLELRALRDEDAERLFELIDASRDHLRDWLPWVDGAHRVEDSLAFIEWAREQVLSRTELHAGLWWQERLVGVIGVRGLLDEGAAPSIGYWIAERWQGHGIVTAACRALVEVLFDRLDVQRVEIHCATGNLRSRAIPERLGFVWVETLREAEMLHGRTVDHAVYRLERGDR